MQRTLLSTVTRTGDEVLAALQQRLNTRLQLLGSNEPESRGNIWLRDPLVVVGQNVTTIPNEEQIKYDCICHEDGGVNACSDYKE